MNEWKEIQLRDICTDISYGYTASATDKDTGFKFLRITDIVNNPFNWESVPFCVINQKDAEKYRLEVGDIVIARTGATTGTTYTIKEAKDAVYASYLIRYQIDNSKADPFFIGYCLRSENWKGYVENIIGGSAQPGANAQQFADYEILLPSLSEQKSIASVLSSLDDKIDLLHRQNKTLEQMAETLYRQWFVEEAQEEWPVDILDNLFDIGIGRTPPRKEQQWFTTNPGDIKWISIKDMGSEGVYMDSTAECLTQQAVEKFNIPVIPPNTVILSFKMTIGRLGITTEEMLSNEAIAHFKLINGSCLYSEYLYLYLKTFRWEQLGSTSSIVEAINSKMIKEMELVVPPKDRLQKFKTIIEPYFLKIRHNQNQLKSLTSTRDLLLSKLMNGTVRVINN